MVPKIMIDEAAKTELVELKVKHSEIIEKNETLSNKAQALETDKNEFETTLTKLKVCVSYPSFRLDRKFEFAKLSLLKEQLRSRLNLCLFLCMIFRTQFLFSIGGIQLRGTNFVQF